MGCIMSRQDVNKQQNLFEVINIDNDGFELNHAKLEITDENIVLHQKGSKSIYWPLHCLKRYGYSEGILSFELGRRSPTGAGIYSFKCDTADVLIQLLQGYLERPVISDARAIWTASVSLSNSLEHISDAPVSRPAVAPIAAKRRSRSAHSYVNTAEQQRPLYANLAATSASYMNLGGAPVNYAELDLAPAPVHADQPPAALQGTGYVTIDFDKTAALSRAVHYHGTSARRHTALLQTALDT